MTERNFGEVMQMWIGVVTNVFDPHESGRVQVRILGKHDDVVNIPNEVLPFAQVLQPVTSAARGRMGTAPVGLVVGSRVIGIWLDRDHQYPLIIGSVGRAGEEREGVTENGAPAIDTDAGSIPAATQASTHNAYTALDNPTRVTVDSIDSGTSDIDITPRNQGPIITEAVEDHMDIPKHPTTAAANDQDTDVLVILRQIDPNSILAALSCFPQNAYQVRNSIDVSSLANGFLNILANALIDALLELADRIGLTNVLAAIQAGAIGLANFQDALNAVTSGGICGAPRALNSIAMGTNALAYAVGNIQMAAAKAGNNPSSVRAALNRPPPVLPRSNIPTNAFIPAALVQVPPAGYTQQYYGPDNDPYPGYIRWVDPLGEGDPVFTLRNGEPNYSSAEEKTKYEAQLAFQTQAATSLTGGSIGSSTLNNLLNNVTASTLSFGLGSVFGFGIRPGSISSFASIIPSIVANVTGIFVPKISGSILPQSQEVYSAVNTFTTQQAILERRRSNLDLGVRRV